MWLFGYWRSAGCIRAITPTRLWEGGPVRIRVQRTIMTVAWVLFVFAIRARQPWLAVCALTVFILITYQVSRTFNSDFSVIEGQNEKNETHFWRNQWTGRV